MTKHNNRNRNKGQAVPVDLEPEVSKDEGREVDSDATHVEEAPSSENNKVVEETKEKTITEMTQEELEVILTDEEDISLRKLESVLKEHRRRTDTLDLAWTLDECRSFLTMSIVPAKTKNGTWVKDVQRNSKEASQWTKEELQAWNDKEIVAFGRASEDNLRDQYNKVFKVKTVQAIEDNQKPAVMHEPVATPYVQRKGLTLMNQQFIEHTLSEYIAKVKPGKAVSQKEGVSAQANLDKLIRYVINLSDPVGFRNGMNIIFETIKRERANGVFNDTYAFRFTDNLSTHSGIQLSHIQILTLFFIYADEDKGAREQYDVQALIKLFPVEKQPLLLQYFAELK